MLKKIAPALLFGLGVLVFAQPATAQRGEFKVIVNTSNPVPSMTRDQVAKIFLKRTSRWEDGREVAPVDLAADTETRREFSDTIHRRNASAIRSYWQQQIFSGRGVPPMEFKTDREVIEYVSQNPGAIGYVSTGANVGPDCKVISIEVS